MCRATIDFRDNPPVDFLVYCSTARFLSHWPSVSSIRPRSSDVVFKPLGWVVVDFSISLVAMFLFLPSPLAIPVTTVTRPRSTERIIMSSFTFDLCSVLSSGFEVTDVCPLCKNRDDRVPDLLFLFVRNFCDFECAF